MVISTGQPCFAKPAPRFSYKPPIRSIDKLETRDKARIALKNFKTDLENEFCEQDIPADGDLETKCELRLNDRDYKIKGTLKDFSVEIFHFRCVATKTCLMTDKEILDRKNRKIGVIESFPVRCLE